jgi:hypothetical protein
MSGFFFPEVDKLIQNMKRDVEHIGLKLEKSSPVMNFSNPGHFCNPEQH